MLRLREPDAAPRGQAAPAPSAAPVLLLATGLDVGGAERVVLDLARGYQAAGVACIVMALADDRALLRLVDTTGLDIRFIGMRKTPAGFAAAVRTVVRTIRHAGVRVVHAHMPHAVFVASAARPFARFALIHTSHNFDFSRTLALALKLTRGLRHVDVLLAPDQHAELNCRRTVMIPNGIQLPARPQPRRPVLGGAPPVLLAVCRLSEQKNPEALVDAFAALRRGGLHPDARLRIAGDGPLKAELVRRIAAAGLGDSVELLGMRQDVDVLLREADVFVMSSRYEGLPLAVLEAGAAGLPVVAPPVGGLPWLLGEDCGFLTPPAALAETLAAVFADPAEARRRADRLHRRVLGGFTLDHVVARHLALYRELAAG